MKKTKISVKQSSIFSDLNFTAPHDYFTHFELSKALSGVKTGDP